MSRLYKRNAVLAIKPESQEGVDPGSFAGTNCMLVSDLTIEPLAGAEVELTYVRPYFGASPSMRVEDYVTLSFTVDLAGASAAGTAPPWNDALKACNVDDDVVSAAVTGTASAGATNTITLAAGSSAVDGFYVGKTVSFGGTGKDFGTPRVVIGYVGSTKVATVDQNFDSAPDNTSTYSIGKSVQYLPMTEEGTTVTIYFNQSGVLHKSTGCRGNVSLEMSANQRPVLKFSMTGGFEPVVDATALTPDFTAWQIPATISSANTKGLLAGFSMGATGLAVSRFSLDFGNAVKHRQLIGRRNVVLTDRQVKGSISFEATTMVTKNWFSAVQTSERLPFYIENGTTAGNIINVLLPSAQLANLKYGEEDGVVMFDADIRALPSAGNDEVRITCK